MRAATLLAVITLTALAACSRTSPEQKFVNDVAAAMGGADRILTITGIVIEGEGTQYNLGQDLSPDAIGQTFNLTDYRRLIDLANGRARTYQTRTPNFAHWAGPAPRHQVQGIDGSIGYDMLPDGTTARVPQPEAADRRTELFHHPLAAVRAALDPAAIRTNLRMEGREILLDVVSEDQAFTLAVDADTVLPTRVMTHTYNVMLGDVIVTTTFDGYQEVDGLQLPSQLTSRTDEFPTVEIRVTSQKTGDVTEDLTAPAAIASAPAVAGSPSVNVTAEELARGVWYLAGQSHHSVLVEFDDHALLIEAPQHDARTLAVIAKARELLPDKPLTQLINTHHHFDHSRGIRAAIAEGLTIITHAGNAEFFHRVAQRPHTIVQDRLSQAPQLARIEPVSNEMTITDGRMTVVLYPVTSVHSETMLMAYLPRERLLVEADLYVPGRSVMPFAAKFLDDVKALNLRIDRVVSLHGTVVSYAQFEKDSLAAAATASHGP